MRIDDPEVLREVEEALDRYERALMANDLAALDALFWNAPQTRRFGATENLYGFESIAVFRRARPNGAPQRVVLRRSITTFGHDAASADIEFQPIGSERIGRQTQCWIRTDEGWRIASAHVSLMV
ncbi:oxalurate catabolism protein HpxZ [Acetobacteraceae bacterium KSS8]|uniref:Oxalurate catabolism protein HpxZ n=1 Tax=Endosaccharibacter trunci TaxID=2812733 RepID=A0ABT1W4V8_9PROT|nr:oxalurate catabolism protein HpxZ [Acetobacteraceae bacterium KSS8]